MIFSAAATSSYVGAARRRKDEVSDSNRRRTLEKTQDCNIKWFPLVDSSLSEGRDPTDGGRKLSECRLPLRTGTRCIRCCIMSILTSV